MHKCSRATQWSPPLVLQMGVVSTCPTSFVPMLHAGFISPADSLLLRCFHLSWDVLFIALTLYFEALPLSRSRGLREKQTPPSSLLSGFEGLAPQTRASSPSMAKGSGVGGVIVPIWGGRERGDGRGRCWAWAITCELTLLPVPAPQSRGWLCTNLGSGSKPTSLRSRSVQC